MTYFFLHLIQKALTNDSKAKCYPYLFNLELFLTMRIYFLCFLNHKKALIIVKLSKDDNNHI